jgi:chaperonin cofactor prefoldin
MSEQTSSINPNTADQDELTTLPGVGMVLAERIIAHRPYRSYEDLRRVPGLGPQSFELMRAMIVIEDPDEPAGVGEAAGGAKSETVASSGAMAGDDQQDSRFMTRSGVLGLSAAVAGVGVIVSILLMLAILIGINRTLDYSRHAAVRELVDNVSRIEVQVEEIESSLTGVEARLGALEGLSGRMTDLENETSDLASEVETAATRVQQMRTRVEEISLQIDELARQTANQSTFFERLQQLLGEVFGTPVEEEPQ